MHLLVLVTHVTNGGKVSAMLHKGAGDGMRNSQLILKCPEITYFSITHRLKKFQSEFGSIRGISITHITNGGKASAM